MNIEQKKKQETSSDSWNLFKNPFSYLFNALTKKTDSAEKDNSLEKYDGENNLGKDKKEPKLFVQQRTNQPVNPPVMDLLVQKEQNLDL
ncbi:MAG: hypothetical protein QNJ31_01335 [Candidatus Caenarcaniphilales bacterium]|nr:hypothetical protein [Candidatus Caenarcaniphilales bacterium]